MEIRELADGSELYPARRGRELATGFYRDAAELRGSVSRHDAASHLPKFVKGYTEKQWGAPADSLSVRLARRFDIRSDDEPRLMHPRHQGAAR